MRLHSLRRDTKGVTAIEFALLAPIMILLLMGLFDLGQRLYAQTLLTGAMQKAARDSTLATGPARTAAIDALVKSAVMPIVGRDADFAPERLNYESFSEIGQPERFSDGAPANGRYDVGECYEDVNGNGRWDSDVGRSGQGGAEDAVLYKMTVTYKRFFPMASLLGWPELQSIVGTTIVRNQPYEDSSSPVVTRCS
ncbi:pilus assembly protein [Allosphingosinicella flava]|uniref:Pilus assembly protein n=1 Tax=Allosphingosinicella flava TaxID=2771430 RepID=A0A7T2GJA0_9SPHN|nr:TadE/TadG family type IV pilus assembly protein [Sphingosinicella flava]QPQ54890.1 pilus assembly protein [Sphingosinicella flava]